MSHRQPGHGADPRRTSEEIFDFAQTYNGYKHHVAQDIVKAEAEDLADFTASGLRRFDPNPAADTTTGVLSGGLLSNEFYRRAFDNQVSMRLRSKEANLPAIRWLQMKSALWRRPFFWRQNCSGPR